MDNKSELNWFGKIVFGIKEMKLYEKILLILSGIVFITYTVYMFHGANADLSSDSVTGTFLAQDIIRSTSWFPSDWNYCGDIWAFRLQIPIAFFSLFINDYFIVRSLSSVFINLFLVFGVIYFCRKTFNNNCWLLVLPVIFMGISNEYLGVVLSDCQYNLNMIMIAVIFGLYVSYLKETRNKARIIKLCFICILIIYSGFSGMRYVQSIDIPLIAAVIISYFYENYKALSSTKKVICEIIKEVFPLLVSMVIGYVAFILIKNSTNYHSGGASQIFASDFFDRVGVLYNLIIGIFGLKSDVDLFSLDGIFNLIKLLGGLTLILVFPVMQLKKFKYESKYMRLLVLFSIVHITEILVLSLFTNMLEDRSRYLYSSFFLLCVISSHYIFKYILSMANIIKIVTVVSTVAFVSPGLFTYAHDIKSYSNVLESRMELVNFLRDNDLKWGYASYWNAGLNSFYSNGDIEINSVNFGNTIHPYYWLNSSERYQPDLYDGKSFLLMTQDELDAFVNSQSYEDLGESSDILYCNSFTIYVYDYNISTNYFGGIGDRSMLSEMRSTVNSDNSEDDYTFELGERWYGPYWTLSDGAYEIVLDCDNESAIFNYQITTSSGQNMIQDGQITGTHNYLDFKLPDDSENCEIILDSLCQDPVKITSLILKRVG